MRNVAALSALASSPSGGFEWRLAWRFLRSSKKTGRSRFIGFISWVSLLGIALGVASLIVVLSIMNGFQAEIRDRMLAIVAHVEVDNPQASTQTMDLALQRIRALPDVRGVAPFIQEQALFSFNGHLQGVQVRGLLPEEEPQVSPLSKKSLALLQERLPQGGFEVVLGSELAQRLELAEGDEVLLLTPKGQMSPVGLLPRSKRLRVSALLHSGYQSLDASVALLHLDDARRIFRILSPNNGWRIRLENPRNAPAFAAQLQTILGSEWSVRDWSQQNPTWFAAVQLEKRMMFVVLSLMVAVAGFNLVSGLVMAVRNKRSDIAILRTLGASPAAIMRIFVMQGAALGIVGTLLGLSVGLLLLAFLSPLQQALETALHFQFFPANVFTISQIPSQIQAGDVLSVLGFSLVLSFVVTLYPSWQAACLLPARALRYE